LIWADISRVSIKAFSHLENTGRLSIFAPEIFWYFWDSIDSDTIENCRLAGLPDLDQGNSYVRQYLKDWIKNLVNTYEFDGIRIDTIPEVPKDFWSEYGQSAGVF
jgi:glycosidase